MTDADLPPLIEFQKMTAEALRTFDSAPDNPEGFALLLVEAIHNHGLRIERDEHALRRTESARAASTTTKKRPGKARAASEANEEEIDHD